MRSAVGGSVSQAWFVLLDQNIEMRYVRTLDYQTPQPKPRRSVAPFILLMLAGPPILCLLMLVQETPSSLRQGSPPMLSPPVRILMCASIAVLSAIWLRMLWK